MAIKGPISHFFPSSPWGSDIFFWRIENSHKLYWHDIFLTCPKKQAVTVTLRLICVDKLWLAALYCATKGSRVWNTSHNYSCGYTKVCWVLWHHKHRTLLQNDFFYGQHGLGITSTLFIFYSYYTLSGFIKKSHFHGMGPLIKHQPQWPLTWRKWKAVFPFLQHSRLTNTF